MMRKACQAACVVALLLPLLSACGPKQYGAGVTNTFADIAMPGAAAQGGHATADRYLAITHRLTLRVPSAEIEALQRKHMAECAKLGCSIVATSIDNSNEGRIHAHASVRIKPESFDAFAAVLAAPPAQITMRAQSSEDLAVPILDDERRLAAKTTLRDRLMAMLRDPSPKSAADLVAIEKELAQAQADVEAITAQRDSLRLRTDMVRVEITYLGAASVLGGADLTPIHQAVRAIGETAVASVAALITTTVAIVPWLPVIALIWWLARRGVRKWRSRKLPG